MRVEMNTPPPGAAALIQEVVASFMEGWNRHDMAQHTAAFAEDADFVDVAGLLMHGRREIADEQGKRHAGRFRESVVKTLKTSTRFLRPDVAVVHHSWEMTGDAGPDGKGLPPRRGIFTFVMSCHGSRWTFDAVHNTNTA